jgi:hypothetical protein
MNERAIKKHIWKAWKEGRVIISRTNDGLLWVSDISSLFQQPESAEVFESRKIFPAIPNEGNSFMVGKCFDQRKGPDVQQLIEQETAKETEPLKITKWFIEANPSYARVFENGKGEKIYINKVYLDLLIGKFEVIEEYRFFGRGPLDVVSVKDLKDQLVALIMPIKGSN